MIIVKAENIKKMNHTREISSPFLRQAKEHANEKRHVNIMITICAYSLMKCKYRMFMTVYVEKIYVRRQKLCTATVSFKRDFPLSDDLLCREIKD